MARLTPDEFGDRLLAGHVDSVVVFAKDMHGYFHYPSQYGPVHLALTFDLLGAQVEACRKRNIKVYGYHCTTWDNCLAEQHPEWLVWKRDRTTGRRRPALSLRPPLLATHRLIPMPCTNGSGQWRADVQVRLNLPLAVKTARAVVAGIDLPVEQVDGGVRVTVPRVPVHEIVCFEV